MRGELITGEVLEGQSEIVRAASGQCVGQYRCGDGNSISRENARCPSYMYVVKKMGNLIDPIYLQKATERRSM